MNYKKLTIYSIVINVLINLIYFLDSTFLTDTIGSYIFIGTLAVLFVVYYIKRYDIKYTKDVIKKDILIGILWMALSLVLGYFLMKLHVELKPCNSGFECLLYGFDFIALAAINILYVMLILTINLTNLFLKKTGLSDKKNIIISIPTGIVIFSLLAFIVNCILQNI